LQLLERVAYCYTHGECNSNSYENSDSHLMQHIDQFVHGDGDIHRVVHAYKLWDLHELADHHTSSALPVVRRQQRHHRAVWRGDAVRG